ncbi:MAG: DUF4239 domain-containing protein [Gammaproteobacteria bacterium]
MRNKVTKKKVIRIITPLLVTAALAAIVLLLVKDFVQYKEIYDDVAAWSAFFSVFGIVYAIVAGFLLVTVLSKYSDLSQVIENELNAIETVRDFLTYLGDEQEKVKTSIKSALSHYTSSLLDTEWPEMSDPREPMDSDTSEELYEVMRKSKNIAVETESEAIVYTAIIDSISDITKLRTRRIALANERLPPRLKVLLMFMSIVIIVAFILLGVQNIFTHLTILVSICISIHLLYMILEFCRR